MVERLAVPKHAAMDGNVGVAGALPDGAEEMAAVAEQDADGVEHDGDVLGHGLFAGLILWRIGRRGGWGVSSVTTVYLTEMERSKTYLRHRPCPNGWCRSWATSISATMRVTAEMGCCP